MMLLLFSGCVGFASQEMPLHWLRKPVRGSRNRKRTQGRHLLRPDRFPIRTNESCIPGNILKGLNRGRWNMGSNPGYCYQAECGYGHRGPLEPQENIIRSRISPSQDKGADLDTPLVPPRKRVAEADTLGKHLC